MTEAYKIGVTVALTNLVGVELLNIISGMKTAEGAAASLKIGLLAVGSGAVIAGIMAVGAAFKAGYEEASKFEGEVAKFRMYGLGDKLNEDAKNFALNMKVAGVSATTSMRLFNEAQGVFRESGRSGPEALEGAKIAAPVLGKLDYINRAMYGDEKHSESLAMLRFIDMMGGNKSPDRFGQLADMGFRLNTTSGGQIDWEQLRQFRARSKAAGFNLSDDLFAELEPIIGELKGSTAGFSLSTAYNRAHGITRPPNQAVDDLIKFGAWDAGNVERNSLGGVKRLRGDPLHDAALFDSDFVAWYNRYIKPQYDRMGLTASQRNRENALMFGSTGGNMMTLVDRQGPVIAASAEAFKKALGIDAAKAVADGTPTGRTERLGSEFQDLLNNLGHVMLPVANYGLRIMTGILKDINGVFSAPGTFIAKAMSFAGSLAGSLNPEFGTAKKIVEHNWSLDAVGMRDYVRENNSAWDKSPINFPYPDKRPAPFVNQVTVLLDGRQVGRSMSDWLNGPPSSGSAFDGHQSYVPVQ